MYEYEVWYFRPKDASIFKINLYFPNPVMSGDKIFFDDIIGKEQIQLTFNVEKVHHVHEGTSIILTEGVEQ